MSNPYFYVPVFHWPTDQSGAGALLYTYLAGGTTAATTYNQNGSTNTNPVTLDTNGNAVVRLNPQVSYHFVLKDSTGANTLFDVDNFSSLFFSASDIGSVFYPATSTEISLGVTPSNYNYPADPFVDPRRYGADPAGNTDSTTAVQTAINVAHAAGTSVRFSGNFKTGALSITLTNSICFFGLGHGTGITVTGSPSAHLTITSPNVDQPAYIWLENFTMSGSSSVNGLVLTSLAQVNLKNVYTSGYAKGLYNNGCIDIHAVGCAFNSGVTGVSATGSASTPPNVMTLENCVINSNTTYGVDYDWGSHLIMRGCDIEANGTTSTYTTGGIHVGTNITNTLGFSHVEIDGCWLESNKGWSIKIDTPANPNTIVELSNSIVLTSDLSHALSISATYLTIRNASSSTGSIWTTAATFEKLENCVANTFTDTSTYPTYINVTDGSTNYPNGKLTQWTATLTGVTATITTTVNTYQQGNEIRHDFPNVGSPLLGTSNTNACTITGMPSAFYPPQNVYDVGLVEDNGTVNAQMVQVSTAGVITLYKGGNATGFTTSGTKGLNQGSIRYRLS